MTTYSGTWRTVTAPGEYSVAWAWPINPALQPGTWPLCNTGATDDVSSLIRGGTPATPIPGPATPRPVVAVPPQWLNAKDDSKAIQAVLDAGNDVLLSGLYFLTSTVTMPAFSRIVGPATVKCTTGTAATTMFQPGSHATLDSLNLYPGGGGRVVLNTQAINAAVKNCYVFGGSLGQVGVGAFFQYNTFDACSVQVYGNHLHWKSLYRNIASAGPSCFTAGGANMAWVDCIWDRTDRGPVFQVGNSSVINSILVRPIVFNVCQTPGGSESFLVEGSSNNPGNFSNNLVWGLRGINCISGVMFSCCTAFNNLFHDLFYNQYGSVLFNATPGTAGPPSSPMPTQQGNVVEDFELWGGTVGFQGNAIGNLFQNGAIVNPSIGRQGTVGFNPAWYGHLAAFTGGATNKAQHVRVKNLGAGNVLAYPGGVDTSVDCFAV